MKIAVSDVWYAARLRMRNMIALYGRSVEPWGERRRDTHRRVGGS